MKKHKRKKVTFLIVLYFQFLQYLRDHHKLLAVKFHENICERLSPHTVKSNFAGLDCTCINTLAIYLLLKFATNQFDDSFPCKSNGLTRS